VEVADSRGGLLGLYARSGALTAVVDRVSPNCQFSLAVERMWTNHNGVNQDHLPHLSSLLQGQYTYFSD